MDHPIVAEPPTGWTTSTAIDHHVSFVEADTGRSLAVTTTENPAAARWNLLGVAGFENPSPIFAENVSRETALSTAARIMAGDDVEPVGWREPIHVEDSDEADDDQGGEDDDSPTGQVDLSTFAE